jgi:hypothetical protein
VRGAEEAIEAGVGFLRRTQLPDGELPTLRWSLRDPATIVHDPAVYGPALIVPALAVVPGAEAVRARVVDFIASQMLRFGIWKYSRNLGGGYPPDIDDTAMASLALRIDGRAVPDNEHVYRANRTRDGLFFTWISPRLQWLRDPRMWLIAAARWRHPYQHYNAFRTASPRHDDVDAVVNSNILFYFGRVPDTEPVIGLILRVLRDGSETTCDKWYDNPFVVWYFFSRALRRAGIDDARAVILDRLRSIAPRTPLEHALAASVLLDWEENADAMAAAVIASQLPSGAWPVEALYKGEETQWGSESLTTGLCLEALARWIAS